MGFQRGRARAHYEIRRFATCASGRLGSDAWLFFLDDFFLLCLSCFRFVGVCSSTSKFYLMIAGISRILFLDVRSLLLLFAFLNSSHSCAYSTHNAVSVMALDSYVCFPILLSHQISITSLPICFPSQRYWSASSALSNDQTESIMSSNRIRVAVKALHRSSRSDLEPALMPL